VFRLVVLDVVYGVSVLCDAMNDEEVSARRISRLRGSG
jgi:hypothetical protein